MKYFVLIALLCAGCASQPGAPSKGGGSSGSSVPAANGSPSTAPAPKSTDSDNAAPSGSEAPVRTASTANSGGGGSAVQTPDERKAAIDRKLDDSLGTFDKELKKEQERTAQERDARGAPAAAGGSAQTEAESATKESSDEAGSSATESPPAAGTADKTPDGQKADRHARPGDLKSDKDRAANAAASGSGATARDIPDGSDDDIVAKRLRKAAEQETDPELKDKLWKEYIEYKKNAGK